MTSQKPGAAAAPAKRRYLSQADVPSVSLEKALRVPRVIAEKYESDPTRPIEVAEALEMTPSSGTFRTLCGAAVGYGLTEGGPNAPNIALSPIGRRIVSPLEVGDDAVAMREAALRPTVAKRFYGKYDGSPLPPEAIARNVLASLEVPADKTAVAYAILTENAKLVGITKQIKDRIYIDIGARENVADLQPEFDATSETETPTDETSRTETSTPDSAGEQATRDAGRRNAIFLGHGSNRAPMDQLIKILDEYGIPHKQAVDEANQGRPIPVKVAEVMRECGAAILVFTGDREYFAKDGSSIWRPSENVSHELGASSVLYGDRIVIFKERGIDLPSNFNSIGYIEFEKDSLNEKGIELFRELVSMKIVSISVG